MTGSVNRAPVDDPDLQSQDQHVSYRIERSESNLRSYGDYWFCIYENERLIAYYWHDYRGDEHGAGAGRGSGPCTFMNEAGEALADFAARLA